jgi:hypothetical protein
MTARVVAGIMGGIAGVLPLAAMNLAGLYGVLDATDVQVAALSGAGALLGGVLLGGVVAGWIAGRQGGAAAGVVAGVIAAALYAVAVIGLVVGGARQGYGPPIIALHPIRTSVALLFVAALLLGVTLVVSWLVGRAQAAAASHYGARPPNAASGRHVPTPTAYSGPARSGEQTRPAVRPPAGGSGRRNWR